VLIIFARTLPSISALASNPPPTTSASASLMSPGLLCCRTRVGLRGSLAAELPSAYMKQYTPTAGEQGSNVWKCEYENLPQRNCEN
jgi:hypothetical protein